MIAKSEAATAQPAGAVPTVTFSPAHGDFEPNYVIQHCAADGSGWRIWDFAYTRGEADNLLGYYNRRYGPAGGEWRLARLVYDGEATAQAAPGAGLPLPSAAGIE